MLKKNPDHSSDESDEELLEIEKGTRRLNSTGRWVATIRPANTSLEIMDDKNPDGKENLLKENPPSTPEQDSTSSKPTPATSFNKPSALRKSTSSEEGSTENETLSNMDTSSGQNTPETEVRPAVSKKKVRFNDEDETIIPSDDATSQEFEYVRSPKSYRLLKDIKIDLSKLIPATARFGGRDESQTQPSPSSSPELSFPGPSFSLPSIPGSSLEDLAAIPGPSYEDPVITRSSSTGRQCIPFFDTNVKRHRRQLNTSSDDDESSEGLYLEPTESRCLFEGKNLNISEPFEWDFADSSIKSLTVSDPTPTQYKLELTDNDMPHIYDSKTNIYTPLKNGDKIEVVADVHPVPQQFCLVSESPATFETPESEPKPLDLSVKDKCRDLKQEEDTDRIDVLPNEDDDESSLIFHLPDEDFDESMAPDNPDWSPSQTFRERRHSI